MDSPKPQRYVRETLFIMKFRYALLPFTLSFLAAPFAGAMIASIGGQAGHNTDPTEDFLENTPSENITEIWNRTVTLGAGTGTYLGNFGGTRWVLTAAHVSSVSGTIETADGKNITLSHGGEQHETFKTTIGGNEYIADLKLFSVSATGESAKYLDYLDSLGNIEIYTNPLSSTSPLYCVGTGKSLAIGSSYASGTPQKEWGEFFHDSSELNLVGTALNSTQEPWVSVAFEENFSKEENSIQCGAQDSGSGVFVKNSNTGKWEVVGIAIAVDTNVFIDANEDNKNDVNPSAVGFSEDSTDSASARICETKFTYLSAYASQIYAIIPEPAAFGLLAGIFALGFAGTRRRRK